MTKGAGLPGLAVVATTLFLFAAALVASRWRRAPEQGGRRDRASLAGIVVQGASFALVATGTHLTLDPLGPAAFTQAALATLCGAAALALFVWARATMGRNWSLVARTRADHRLVTTGPFAYVRHPIYVALALLLIGVAIGLGHAMLLVVALPVYALGTWLRIRSEERLLATMFAAAFDSYAARTARFVPGLF